MSINPNDNTVDVSIIGVNNGSINTQATSIGARRVLITPLGQTSQFVTRSTVIDKVLLKAVTKAGQKKDKIFTLRGIDTSKVLACDDLKKLIKRQLDDDVIEWEEFDIGYSQQ